MIPAAITGYVIGVLATLALVLRGVRDLTPYERTWISLRRKP